MTIQVSRVSKPARQVVSRPGPTSPHSLEEVVERELAEAAAEHAQFGVAREPVVVQQALIAFCVLVNVAFCLIRRDYVFLFVAASFYLNMFYFISLLVPTSPGTTGFRMPELEKFQSWLKENGITAGTRQFTRLFINAFFMNSRTLTFGLGLLFSVDIAFTLIGWYAGLPGDVSLFVIAQSAVIILFYLLIWKVEPFTMDFADHLDLVKHHLSRDLPAWIISLLFLTGFLIVIFLIMTTIILMPGITLGAFLNGSGLTELAHMFVPIAVLALTQYVIIRFIHGMTSRAMAGRLMEYRKSTLFELRDRLFREPVDPANRQEFRLYVTERILESKVYRIKRNALLGAFPVYVIDLDFSVLMDSPTLVAIRGYLRQKKG